MTYFLFSITNGCDRACPYCVVKKWMNNPEFPDKITKEDALTFFGLNARRGDFVEITGGEPTLVEWLWELADFLDKKGVNMLLRTNGANARENVWKRMVVCYNPHGEEPVKARVFKNRCVIYKPKILDDLKSGPFVDLKDCNWHPFEKMMFVTADGKIRPMNCKENVLGWMQDGTKIEGASPCCLCPYILQACLLRFKAPRADCL